MTGNKDPQEGFLARWSRLKRRGPDEAEPGAFGSDGAAAPPPGEEPVDVAALPRIEELTAGSDLTAFLRKGVPEELRRLALRKAWSLDPAIRDFVEVAENQYNWNDPAGVPGFGEIAPGTDMSALLQQAAGALRDLPRSPGELPPQAPAAETGRIAGATAGEGDLTAAGRATPAGAIEQPSTAPDAELAAQPAVQPQRDPAQAAGLAPPPAAGRPRRRHGGALPRLPAGPTEI